jgi:hypothetical protein
MVLLQRPRITSDNPTYAMPIPPVLPNLTSITHKLRLGDIIFVTKDFPTCIWILSKELKAQPLLADGTDILIMHADIEGPGITTESLNVISKVSTSLKLVPKGENHLVMWWVVACVCCN